MLKKLREFIHPPQSTGLPFNLKPAELARVKELRGHPHWPIFLGLLDKLTTLSAEDMLQASTTEAVLHYRSYILGIRRAGTVVDEMITGEKANDARRNETRRGTTDDARRLALYGSPYYTAVR